MPKYLTTQQYLLANDGMSSAASMQTEALANFILRAEADIDAFMGFNPMLGGFEPHSSWYQTGWNQRTLKTLIPNVPVPVRSVDRYRIQVSNASSTGAGFFANIQTSDIAINVLQGYLELVPLQSITYAMTPVLVEMGMRPPVVQVDYEVGYYLPAWGDTLYDMGDGKTFRATRGFWAHAVTVAPSITPYTTPACPPNVYVNGTLQSSSAYTVNYTEGSISFSSSQSGNTITCDYCYQIPDTVKAATIAQTSYLIGQSDLNLMGLSGIDMARNDHQEMRRTIKHGNRNAGKAAISPTAASLLDQYIGVALG